MKLYLVLTDTSTILSRTIKWFSKNEYNHASLSLDQNLDDIYSFGRIKAHNPFIGGFVHEDLTRDYFQRAFCSISVCEISEEQYHFIQNTIQYYEQFKNMYRFNLLGIIALALNINFKRRDAFFCSQFVALLLSESHVHRFQKELHLVTPQDLENLFIFKPVYEGLLYDYLDSVQQKPLPLTTPIFSKL